eukprot:COSAG01_NODE_2425_length_7679_cov_96.031221_5_plen_146_part_00
MHICGRRVHICGRRVHICECRAGADRRLASDAGVPNRRTTQLSQTRRAQLTQAPTDTSARARARLGQVLWRLPPGSRVRVLELAPWARPPGRPELPNGSVPNGGLSTEEGGIVWRARVEEACHGDESRAMVRIIYVWSPFVKNRR